MTAKVFASITARKEGDVVCHSAEDRHSILITKHMTPGDISGISAATVNTNTGQISNTDYTLELPTSIVESAI